jgi:hypothetical protein
LFCLKYPILLGSDSSGKIRPAWKNHRLAGNHLTISADVIKKPLDTTLEIVRNIKLQAELKFQHFLETNHMRRPSLPLDILRIIGIKLFSSMFKDAQKESATLAALSDTTLQSLLPQIFQFSLPGYDSAPELTQHATTELEQISYSRIADKGAKLVVQRVQRKHKLPLKDVQQNIAQALVNLQQQRILPAFLDKEKRGAAYIALSQLRKKPTLENIQVSLQKRLQPIL